MQVNNNEVLRIKYILKKRTYLYIIIGVPIKWGTRVVPVKNWNNKKYIKNPKIII